MLSLRFPRWFMSSSSSSSICSFIGSFAGCRCCSVCLTKMQNCWERVRDWTKWHNQMPTANVSRWGGYEISVLQFTMFEWPFGSWDVRKIIKIVFHHHQRQRGRRLADQKNIFYRYYQCWWHIRWFLNNSRCQLSPVIPKRNRKMDWQRHHKWRTTKHSF